MGFLFGGGGSKPRQPKQTGPKQIKIVLVGDTTVGKSCLVINYQRQVFDDLYEPTVLDVFKGTRKFNDKDLPIEIHDTSGDAHLGVNRAVSYNRADAFMLCVAINNRDSFDNVRKWRTEIRQVCKDVPIILVGTKSDLRESCADPVTIE